MALRLETLLTALYRSSPEWILVVAGAAAFFSVLVVWPGDMRFFYACVLIGLGLYFGISAVQVWRVIRDWNKPLNYKSLAISDEGLRYEGLLSTQRWSVKWADIAAVSFARDEAVYDDYLETMWTIGTDAGERLEVMDESNNRKQLLKAFQQYLPGFDLPAAERAIKARRQQGEWTCFRKS